MTTIEPVADPRIDEDDAAWPTHQHARSVRLRPATALLAVLLLAVGGVWGGAWLEKRHGGSAASAAGGAAVSSFAARAGAGGFGGAGATGGAAAGGATTGTVTEVTPKLLYLTSATGALVKIQLTAKTTYTRTSNTSKGGLALGDSAIVIGAKNASGTVVATSVIATQKGVTATRRGFAGGGTTGGGGFGG